MEELIYGPKSIEEEVKKKWPIARIKDASDSVHEERFEVSIRGVDKKEFWNFAFGKKFLSLCFGFRLWARFNPEALEFIKQLGKEQNGKKD